MAGNAIDELVSTLYEMVQDAGGIPLMSDRCVIEREKALDILDEIRANIPSDLKMAREIVEKRNEFITAGKREAEAIRKQAEELARQKVNENDIMNEARRRSAEIIRTAEERAKELMGAATDGRGGGPFTGRSEELPRPVQASSSSGQPINAQKNEEGPPVTPGGPSFCLMRGFMVSARFFPWLFPWPIRSPVCPNTGSSAIEDLGSLRPGNRRWNL